MKVYTRTGDDGSTSLSGGYRVPKHDIRVEAFGTVDELISWIGLLRELPENCKRSSLLLSVQDKLMHCASVLSTGPGEKKSKTLFPDNKDITAIESEIDSMESALAKQDSFIIPGGNKAVSYTHISRCVCRRAERVVCKLSETEEINSMVQKYLNRLSDLLFVLARTTTMECGIEECRWIPEKK